jgi:dipeptidyl aminopeptidase/acylaminoacyl peptidase
MKMLLALLLAGPALAADRPAYAPKSLALVRQITSVEAAPDGKEAYFATDITGAMELWKVPANGGWPIQLTDLGQQVTETDISSDGKRIILASDYGGDERPDLFLLPAEGGPAENLTQSTRAETSPVFSPDGGRLAFLADPAEPFVFNLFVMDLATRKERQLTHETVNVHFPLWSPDGKLIAATRTGDDRAGDLILAAADGSMIEYGFPPVKGGIVIPQAWSPDGKLLLTTAEDEHGFHRLYLLERGKGRFIGPSGADVEHAHWNKTAGIVFTRDESGASALYRLRSPEAKLERLTPTKGRVEGISLDAAGRFVFYDWSDSSHAPDAWKLELATGKRLQLTHSMLGGVKSDELAQGEIISYESFDGKNISAVYLKPPVARLGTPPPVVVMVHGGPDWQSYDDFHPMRQALSEAGFAVLAPNFRGSTGFGRAFLDANRKDWGGGDRKDLIAGVKYLAARGDVDPKRAGITGGSFGGYSTLYALARNQGEWAAGVAAYGMPDLALDYELSKSRFASWYETQMGNPKDDAVLFKERSAITYLDDLKAPLLIFQGANDTNVPLPEAELVYKRLKKLGRDVDMVVYPDEGHGFSRRKNLTDYYERAVAFFSSKLAPETSHIGPVPMSEIKKLLPEGKK